MKLTEALNIANGVEKAQKDLCSLPPKEAVLLLEQSRQANRPEPESFLTTFAGKAERKPRPFCDFCKKPGHTLDTCFKRAICGTCGQVGHISKFCRNRKFFSLDTSGSTQPFVKGQLLGKELNFLLDAGASLSILNQRLVDQFNWHDQLEDKATTATLAD